MRPAPPAAAGRGGHPASWGNDDDDGNIEAWCGLPANLCLGLNDEWFANNGAWQGCQVDEALMVGWLALVEVHRLVCDGAKHCTAKGAPRLSLRPFYNAIIVEAVGVGDVAAVGLFTMRCANASIVPVVAGCV